MAPKYLRSHPKHPSQRSNINTSTPQQEVDENGFAILKTTSHTFKALDAHEARVAIKNAHPEHPNLTAYALSILYPDEVKKPE